MSLAIVHSRASLGVDAPAVIVEVHLSNGLPSFGIVGLPDTSIKESRDRVRSALINAHFRFPDKKVTVNLSPADLPKEGGRFDLPIAIGILAACGQIPVEVLDCYEFVGELALSGEVRPIAAEIPTVLACHRNNRTSILPTANAENGALVQDAEILAVGHLLDVFYHLTGQQPLQPYKTQRQCREVEYDVDLQDVVGQPMAKRALEIAAGGGHNLLFTGPAGTGKSMLAHRLATILPPMSDDEALQSAAIHSICGKPLDVTRWKQRPFRAPHHTASGVALVGGGSNPKPGEISLAHHGVLFLDELPEFDRRVLDVLREPLESNKVTISRANRQAEFPARFQLVCAMNPSPTGNHDDGRASPAQVLRYLNRLSTPFLDRIDIQIEVPRLEKGMLSRAQYDGESSAAVRQRVIEARQIQLARSGCCNAMLSTREVARDCSLMPEDSAFLEDAVERLGLSTRVFHKVLKVSRTIADLQGARQITREHLAEALGYRALDRLIRRLSL